MSEYLEFHSHRMWKIRLQNNRDCVTPVIILSQLIFLWLLILNAYGVLETKSVVMGSITSIWCFLQFVIIGYT